MSEERKRNPRIDLKQVVRLNKPVRMVLVSEKPVASGEGKYGEWNLWVAKVEHLEAVNPDTGEKYSDYSGEAVFFAPNEKINAKMLEITGSTQRNVPIEISKEPYEMDNGNIVGMWSVKKVGEGEPSPSALSPTEQQLVNDVKTALGEGYDITFDEFYQISQEDAYKSANITEERAKELYKML